MLLPPLLPFRRAAALALSLAAVLFLAHPAPALAQPQQVWMGMYVVDLTDMDLKSGGYDGDFYLWMRWEGEYDPSEIEIMNGTGEPCSLGLRRQHGGLGYAVFRCRYRFHGSFDLADYPLDEQELTIEVEHKSRTESELVFVPDRENTVVDSAVHVPGWVVGTPRIQTTTHRYTSLGDPVLQGGPGARYSRVVMAIPLRRDGVGVYFKSFLVMFLSVGVGLLGCLLRCEHMEARLGLGLASIFGVVSSYVVVAQALPETAQFTLADQLHLVGMVFVFIAILAAVVTYRLSERMGSERAEQLDRRVGLVTALGFAVAVAAVTALH